MYKINRIDTIALNGGDGLHYKYEEITKQILEKLFGVGYLDEGHDYIKDDVTSVMKILVEAFPNDET